MNGSGCLGCFLFCFVCCGWLGQSGLRSNGSKRSLKFYAVHSLHAYMNQMQEVRGIKTTTSYELMTELWPALSDGPDTSKKKKLKSDIFLQSVSIINRLCLSLVSVPE